MGYFGWVELCLFSYGCGVRVLRGLKALDSVFVDCACMLTFDSTKLFPPPAASSLSNNPSSKQTATQFEYQTFTSCLLMDLPASPTESLIFEIPQEGQAALRRMSDRRRLPGRVKEVNSFFACLRMAGGIWKTCDLFTVVGCRLLRYRACLDWEGGICLP